MKQENSKTLILSSIYRPSSVPPKNPALGLKQYLIRSDDSGAKNIEAKALTPAKKVEFADQLPLAKR